MTSLNEASITPPEFVAVVLAATAGARLFPLTSKQTPKHLLPIGGIPLLLYLLNNIEKSGFEAAVVALAKDDNVTIAMLKQQEDIQVLSSTREVVVLSVGKKLKVSCCFVSEDCPGSADALRQVDHSLPPSSHVVIMPSDMIVLGPKAVTDLARIHRQEQPCTACTMLLADVGELDANGVPLKESAKQKKGGLAREEQDMEYIGLAFQNNNSAPRVVWKQSKLEVEENDDLVGKAPQLTLPKPRLRKSVMVRVRTEWDDLHTYILSPWVRRWLSTSKQEVVSSLQGDVLPRLISRQFRGIAATFGQTDKLTLEQKECLDSVLLNHQPKDDDPSRRRGHEYSVSAHVVADKERMAALRASSIPAYLVACREVVSRAVLENGNNKSLLPEGSTLQPKFRSVLLQDATLGDKVTCKSSTVGRRSKLGSRCRLNNVIVMDDVTVGENCVLQNSILGAGCNVGENCNLNDCQVGPGKSVPSGTKAKGESFFEDATDGV